MTMQHEDNTQFPASQADPAAEHDETAGDDITMFEDNRNDFETFECPDTDGPSDTETPVSGDAGAPRPDEQPIPEETLEKVKEERDAQHDKYLRLMAEFDNYKRRTSREYQRLIESANESLILDIIEIRENFDRAFKAENVSSTADGFLGGMKMIYNKLDQVLEKNGMEVFTGIGDEFDPQLHDALMKTPHENIPAEHICEVFEKGYKLRGKVIKHARVIVSSGCAVPENENADAG